MRKRLFIFIILIIFLGFLSYYLEDNQQKIGYLKKKAFVIKVIDGDTLDIDNERIRLLGVNTPEKGKQGYKEAFDYLKTIENKSIYVLRDIEDEDKYNRKLRYVFFESQLINADILQKGLGTLFMNNNLKYEDKLIIAENFARENELGLWKKSKDKCAFCIELLELDYNEEFFILKNNCNFKCEDLEVKDNANHFFKIELKANESFKQISKNIWNNEGDRFFLRDSNGLILYYEY